MSIGKALYAEPKHTVDLRPMIDEAIERINFAVDEHIRAKLIELGWTPPAAKAVFRELIAIIDRDGFDTENSREDGDQWNVVDLARDYLK